MVQVPSSTAKLQLILPKMYCYIILHFSTLLRLLRVLKNKIKGNRKTLNVLLLHHAVF